MSGGPKGIGYAAIAAFALLLAPAAASAADTFADANSGNNSNDCLTPATACLTIGAAVGKATSGSTVHVEPGTYAENVTLPGGISLVAASGNPVIAPTTGFSAVHVTGGPGATIQGLTFSASVSNLTFVNLDDDAGSMIITGNTFNDPTPTNGDNQSGIRTSAQGTPQISDNTFTHLFHGIDVVSPAAGLPGVPTISGNDISGVHDIGDGIQVAGQYNGPPYPLTGPTTATLVGNTIHAPGAGQSVGVFLADGGSFSLDGASPATGMTMIRNRIVGGTDGVEVIGNRAPVNLFGDVIARTAPLTGGTAVQASSVKVSTGTYLGGDLTVTNADIVNNTNLSFELQDNHLTLDSSIVRGGAILNTDGDGTATCTITFSDGMTTSGDPCETFQTSVAPSFVNAAADDYHLTPVGNTALIDQGNPLAPPAGATDFDGDPRAIDADATCPLNPVRDIGADEVNNGIVTCPPPPTPPIVDLNPPPSTTGVTPLQPHKKCKRKHKRASTAAKKCKRRKRR